MQLGIKFKAETTLSKCPCLADFESSAKACIKPNTKVNSVALSSQPYFVFSRKEKKSVFEP